jgi:hypothetical protein
MSEQTTTPEHPWQTNWGEIPNEGEQEKMKKIVRDFFAEKLANQPIKKSYKWAQYRLGTPYGNNY